MISICTGRFAGMLTVSPLTGSPLVRLEAAELRDSVLLLLHNRSVWLRSTRSFYGRRRGTHARVMVVRD
jgi:hypothetical protein